MFCDQIPQDDTLITTVELDLENQRVVKADADRTRASEHLNKDNLEMILTLYCKRNNLKYKQGLNEVSLNTSIYASISAKDFNWRFEF